MTMIEKLRVRLAESRAQREREMVHPRDCKCGGHGNIPVCHFGTGYEKCEG